MKLINRKNILLFGAVCVVGFLLPLLLKKASETWSNAFALSFTIVSSLGTIATLIVAVFLYDRFGINARFKEKQVDKVIELAILLKQTDIFASTNQRKYNVHAVQSVREDFEHEPFFKADRIKTILFPSNLFSILTEITLINDSYWLPKEIKTKMKFLEVLMLNSVENPLSDNYIRLEIGKQSTNDWLVSVPKLTFEMFTININNLFKEINDWLKKHSDIPIDLKLY